MTKFCKLFEHGAVQRNGNRVDKICTQGRLTARRSDTIPQRAQTAGQQVRLSTRAAFAGNYLCTISGKLFAWWTKVPLPI